MCSLSISIFRSLWILPGVEVWSVEFVSWSFNLHFQEPLNLTGSWPFTPTFTTKPFNLHFQEPLNLTRSCFSFALEALMYFQSPFSGAFESYSDGVYDIDELVEAAFNLHFQEPLNLTELRLLNKSPISDTFNLHFQEPLNLTNHAPPLLAYKGSTFNLHFQEPLNLTNGERFCCPVRLLWRAFNLHFQEPLNLTGREKWLVLTKPKHFQSPFSGAFESYGIPGE